MKNYHNTTEETGNDLFYAESKATKQDEIILNHFKANPEAEFIASEIWINLFETESTPLTSIRRSVNTLLNDNKIIRQLDLDCNWKKKVCQVYGRKVFIYKLKN